MTEPVLAALDETWEALLGVLDDLDDADWQRPTPCDGWSVHDLAAHLGAIEGFFQGLPQPEDPPPPTAGIDAWTAAGVEARRSWSHAQVVEEATRASNLQRSRLHDLDGDGWEGETFGPLGPTTERARAEIRVMDLYLHLLDLRAALGRPVLGTEDAALAVCVDRAVAMTPWGAVKKVGLGDGAHVRLTLHGVGGREADLVVEGGRGSIVEPTGEPEDRITGLAAAYLLTAAGRRGLAAEVGTLTVDGNDARRLVAGYRIFS